jgi:hypothetical protein
LTPSVLRPQIRTHFVISHGSRTRSTLNRLAQTRIVARPPHGVRGRAAGRGKYLTGEFVVLHLSSPRQATTDLQLAGDPRAAQQEDHV